MSSELDGKVAVITGGAGGLGAGLVRRFAAQIPDGRSAVVDGAGHCPQIEQPEALNRVVLNFLKEVG